MPKRVVKRQWCKTCQDYTIHDTKKIFDKEWFCESCDTEYTKTDISEIPQEKLQEQRERYKKYRFTGIGDIYTQFLLGVGMNPFNSPLYNTGLETDIKEDDAGQRELDEIRTEEIRLERNKQLQIRKEKLELKEKYKNLGRNDTCICGSGKKYKKCCLTEISKIK